MVIWCITIFRMLQNSRAFWLQFGKELTLVFLRNFLASTDFSLRASTTSLVNVLPSFSFLHSAKINGGQSCLLKTGENISMNIYLTVWPLSAVFLSFPMPNMFNKLTSDFLPPLISTRRKQTGSLGILPQAPPTLCDRTCKAATLSFSTFTHQLPPMNLVVLCQGPVEPKQSKYTCNPCCKREGI